MSSLWAELKRRNVIRVGAFYAVAGWLLLQVADILFGLLDVPGWGLRLVLGLLLLGFPLVLVFSWVYEMTPEGLKRESQIDRSNSVTPVTGRKIDRLIIVSLILVVAVLIADRLLLVAPPNVTQPAPESGTGLEVKSGENGNSGGVAQAKSIAVLPFVNMSGDEENEYFSDGLTEELLNLLAKVDDLRVSSRTSSFAFKGKDTSIPSVASQLKVANILEGSVRKSGMQVRITAQLIDVETDSHLWSETYDRNLDDIFAIQDEIAQAVVEALKVQLLHPGETAVADERRETSTDAYLLYLRGRHTYEAGRDTRDNDLVERAMSQFEQVLEIDPDYALAYAGLADAYGLQSIRGTLSMAEGYERSRQMAEKALAIDPDLVEALLALADIQLEYDWDMEAAEKSYRRALEIRPSDAEGLRTYGYFLFVDGRPEEAIDYYRKALEVDPLQVRAYLGMAASLIYAERYSDLPELTESLAQHKDDEFMKRWSNNLQIMELRHRRQYKELIPLLPEEPDTMGDLGDAAISYYYGGDPEKAQNYLQQMIEIANEESSSYSVVASALAQMDQPDLAIEYLEKALEAHEVVLGFIRTDSDFAPLHEDPRYLDILKRAGLKPPSSQ